MSHASERHPVLGWDRDLNSELQLCSLCEHAIPEDAVPLTIFGGDRPDGDCYAWIYCDDCTDVVLIATKGRP